MEAFKIHTKKHYELIQEAESLPTYDEQLDYFNSVAARRERRGLLDDTYYVALYMFVVYVVNATNEHEIHKKPDINAICMKKIRSVIAYVNTFKWPADDVLFIEYKNEFCFLMGKLFIMEKKYSSAVRILSVCKDYVKNKKLIDMLIKEKKISVAVESSISPIQQNWPPASVAAQANAIAQASVIAQRNAFQANAVAQVNAVAQANAVAQRDASPKRRSKLIRYDVSFTNSTKTQRVMIPARYPSDEDIKCLRSVWETCRTHITHYSSCVLIPDEYLSTLDMQKQKAFIAATVDCLNLFNKTGAVVNLLLALDILINNNCWYYAYNLYVLLLGADEPISVFIRILILEMSFTNDINVAAAINKYMEKYFEKIQPYISPEYVQKLISLSSTAHYINIA